MKALSIIAKIILAVLLTAGFGLNNLWRWMPEFHSLDSVSAFSIYLQISLLLFAFLALFLGIRGKQVIRWIFFVIAALVAVLSWYSIRVSNSENALFYGIVPFADSKVRFPEVKSIKLNPSSFVIEPVSTVVLLPPKMLGFDDDPVIFALQSYGDCLQEDKKSRCVEIDFVWP